jgi:hypothetical protein
MAQNRERFIRPSKLRFMRREPGVRIELRAQDLGEFLLSEFVMRELEHDGQELGRFSWRFRIGSHFPRRPPLSECGAP